VRFGTDRNRVDFWHEPCRVQATALEVQAR
jgi:hypothetical protein